MKTNEALALLYLQKDNTPLKNPGDLLVMYKSVLRQINEKENDLYEAGRMVNRMRDNARRGPGVAGENGGLPGSISPPN